MIAGGFGFVYWFSRAGDGGERVAYRYQGRRQNDQAGWSGQGRCEVAAAEQITVPAGTFGNSWRVVLDTATLAPLDEERGAQHARTVARERDRRSRVPPQLGI